MIVRFIVKAFLFLVFSTILEVVEAEERQLPHIILIVADDLGWNDVGIHGSQLAPTPHVDALAAAGRLLHQHYALPTCTPSRSSLLTGRHAAATGMQGFPLKAGEPRGLPLELRTLPELLAERGYATRLVGKWHLGAHRSDYLPTRRGFHSHLGYRNGYVGYFDHGIEQMAPDGEAMSGFDLWRDEAPSWEEQGQYLTHVLTAEATSAVREHARTRPDAPLFLQLAHLAVHTGNDSTPLEVPDPAAAQRRFAYEPDAQRRIFAEMLSQLDESVGSVLETLRDTGMLNNSIVIFISDNGGMSVGLHCNTGSNWPLRGTKHTLFEGGVRTVGVVWSPLLPRRAPYAPMLHISDWAPTLLAAVDGKPTALQTQGRAGLMEGVSHWEALTAHDSDEVPTPRSEVLLNIDDVIGHSGIRSGRWKYVEGYHQADGLLDGHVGASARGEAYPPYDAEATADAARRLGLDAQLSAQDVLRTRAQAEISCNGLEDELGRPACADGCLFDVQSDPCEMRDLSLRRPEMLSMLRAQLEAARADAAAQLNRPVDPAADPALHGGMWAPWLDATAPGGAPRGGQEADGVRLSVATSIEKFRDLFLYLFQLEENRVVLGNGSVYRDIFNGFGSDEAGGEFEIESEHSVTPAQNSGASLVSNLFFVVMLTFIHLKLLQSICTS